MYHQPIYSLSDRIDNILSGPFLSHPNQPTQDSIYLFPKFCKALMVFVIVTQQRIHVQINEVSFGIAGIFVLGDKLSGSMQLLANSSI